MFGRLLAFLTLDRDDRLVAVRSWRPRMGKHGLEWPVMLVDKPSYRRSATPVWDRARLRNVWRRLCVWQRID